MHIAICEDERSSANALLSIINNWGMQRHRHVATTIFTNAESFLAQWMEPSVYDLVFLDINLGNMSGYELAEKIRKINDDIPLVFVTSFKDYVFRAFDINALNYLVKPVDANRCFETLDKTVKIIEGFKKKCFTFYADSKMISISFNRILYIDATGHWANIHTSDEVYRFREKFSSIEERLPKPFFCRCHRSVIVSLESVFTLKRKEIQLKDEKKTILPVSKSYWAALNESFAKYYGGM